jgi:hypothetical protein
MSDWGDMTDPLKPRDWDEWRKGSGWSKTGQADPFTFPKGEDQFAFYLTEVEWEKVRYVLKFYIEAIQDIDEPGELVSHQAIAAKLATENWAGFQLSKDRSASFKPTLIAHPGLTDCCQERMFRVSQSARWRCYGCGRML